MSNQPVNIDFYSNLDFIGYKKATDFLFMKTNTFRTIWVIFCTGLFLLGVAGVSIMLHLSPIYWCFLLFLGIACVCLFLYGKFIMATVNFKHSAEEVEAQHHYSFTKQEYRISIPNGKSAAYSSHTYDAVSCIVETEDIYYLMEKTGLIYFIPAKPLHAQQREELSALFTEKLGQEYLHYNGRTLKVLPQKPNAKTNRMRYWFGIGAVVLTFVTLVISQYKH